MEQKNTAVPLSWRQRLAPVLLIVVGIAVNIAIMALGRALGLELNVSVTGTAAAAILGGTVPGLLVAYLSGLAAGILWPSVLYYSCLGVLVVPLIRFFRRWDFFRLPAWLLTIPLFSLITGDLGVMLSLVTQEAGASTGLSARLMASLQELPYLTALRITGILVHLPDAVLASVLVVLLLNIAAKRKKRMLALQPWCQTPLTEQERRELLQRKTRGLSLRSRLLLLIGAAMLLVTVGSTAIAFFYYHRTTIQEREKIGEGATALVAAAITPEAVDRYLREGEEAPGYREDERQLYTIRDSIPGIEYLYVYRILEDGCHVVFDLDTEGLEGGAPGELVPFDESFSAYLPALLAGEAIEPVISNDTYGWLLTLYRPVYDAAGVCQCYACVDISMGELASYEIAFLTRVLTTVLGLFLLVIYLGLWMAEYHVILPINAMAQASSAFAFDSEEVREGSLERLRDLNIRTGDEIENLYEAVNKTTGDTMRYINDIHSKSDMITRMQNGLILVLADMVESRDQCTGDHVRKTAAYTDIILREMQKEGIYADALTPEFREDVVNSAPLHDVGKIKISDVLLNKPGKLTDEEYREMKKHTVAGAEIIDHAMDLVDDAGYLLEARNLAEYHHERWDGKGYPNGLAGEEIPLSARIMAVADVFDALVSRRSYKKPFSFETAMDIIREGAGSHFDPLVAQAFLNAADEVRQVAEHFGETEEKTEA